MLYGVITPETLPKVVKKLKKEQLFKAFDSIFVKFKTGVSLVWHNKCPLAGHLYAYCEERGIELIEFMFVKDLDVLNHDVAINCFIPVYLFGADEIKSSQQVKVLKISADEFTNKTK